MDNRLNGVHVRERQLDLVHRCERVSVHPGRLLGLFLYVDVASERINRVLLLAWRCARGPLCFRNDSGDSGDLRQTGRLGRFGGVVGNAALQGGLVYEAPLAPERVFEGDEEQEAYSDEDGKKPERRAPVEALCKDAAKDRSERRPKKRRAGDGKVGELGEEHVEGRTCSRDPSWCPVGWARICRLMSLRQGR